MTDPMEVGTSDRRQIEVDEGLYSRQLYVMGHEAQRRMAGSDVLVSGLDGVGVELAKNIVLAGVKSVTLHDPSPAGWEDLSANFFLTEKDIGNSRAASCATKLAELNRYVQVTVVEGELTDEMLQRFQCVVLVGAPLETQLCVDDFCHAQGICFVAAEARGVFGYIFCDFGSRHVVSDKDGEQAAGCLIGSVTKDSPALVTVNEDHRHNLIDGDIVTFASMDGMAELEGREFAIKERSPFSFEIDCDTTGFSTFRSGYVNQVKKPVVAAFRPLREALLHPEPFMETDFAKIGRPGILHQAFRALHQFRARHGGLLPEPGDPAQADEVFAAAAAIDDEAGASFKADVASSKDVVRQLALCSRGVLSPMCATLGGIAGQEVLKACSGKFSPIKQWLYYDAAEALPDTPLPPEHVRPRGCRYDGQIMVFGRALQEALGRQSPFLVGAGAIGCEMLKNWAMMGVGCGEGGGTVHITDMDNIEKSNLSRQFLFREKDIGQAKSKTAAAKAAGMNPAMKVIAYENKCAPDTESFFNDEFYESLSFVCTALDNIEARLYMDQRCLFYKKPMFESGTLGTKGNTQIVVPFLTENYGASRDPPEKSIPVCTLKNFPNQIEHTLQWARDWFEGAFKQTAEDVNLYLSDPHFTAALNTQQNTKLETLKRIEDSLGSSRPTSFEECIVWARIRFEAMFHNEIAQLLHNFPKDSVTSTGNPFWSGAKRPPTPVTFDAADALHLDFIIAAANLRAQNYGITGTQEAVVFLQVLPNVMVPDFTPADGVRIPTTEAEAKEQSGGGAASGDGAPSIGNGGNGGGVMMDVDEQCKQIVGALPTPASMAGFRLREVEFDKDVDAHMAFVTAASNLRARCYRIPEADMHRSRLIAGKIIPAIATTTALVTGLVCMELYKLLLAKPLEAYKNWFLNLALPQFACSEPIPPAKTTAVVKGREWKWSAWDCIDIDMGDITLRQLFDYFVTEYNLEVTMLSHGVSILYSFFANKKKIAERMEMPISKLVESVTKQVVRPEQKFLILEVCAQDIDTGDELEIPYVRFRLPSR